MRELCVTKQSTFRRKEVKNRHLLRPLACVRVGPGYYTGGSLLPPALEERSQHLSLQNPCSPHYRVISLQMSLCYVLY